MCIRKAWLSGALIAVVAVAWSCSSDDSGAATGTGGSAGSASGGSGGSAASAGGSGGSPSGALQKPEAGLKIALFGDQGNRAESREVLEMITEEKADFVIHLGDFDYGDDPPAWEKLMDDGLGDLPWVAVVGNHDIVKLTEYQEVIERKLKKSPKIECEGQPGLNQSCSFRGLKVVLSAVGLYPTDHVSFLNQELGASDHLWRICGWHLNQADMNLGGKEDVTGYKVHQECAKVGAMVVNGHEHTYGRTYTLADVGNAAMGHGSMGDYDLIELAVGRTFVMYNGMGGVGLRDYESQHDTDTWWAAGYASNMTIIDNQRTPVADGQAEGGAVFIEFGVDGDDTKARGTFKTIDGKTFDEWTITIDPAGL